MSIEMKMPRLSDTMEQGTVVKWNVKPGQKVKSGDVVADIETDKATMELQTYDDGVVAALAVPEGQSVKVGTLILMLATGGEDWQAVGSGAASAAPAKHEAHTAKSTQVASSAEAQGSKTGGDRRATQGGQSATGTAVMEPPAANGTHAPQHGDRVFASPLARKIAGESGIDLRSIEGTGPSGRIVRKDVESAISTSITAPDRGQQAISQGAITRPAVNPLPAPGSKLAGRMVPLSNMRKTIAKRLVESKTTIPHYQVTVSVRMDALLALRTQLNDQLAAQGVKLSVNDFLVRACALAMHQHPYINSRWVAGQAEAVEFLPTVNIGVAIALPVADDGSGGGLVVATIRNADQIGLRSISSQSKTLSEKARGKGLSLDEMSDTTFTISNLGMFGVDHFTAIINPPNTAILAVGGAIEKAVVDTNPKTGEKRLIIGHEMSMTMSSDHRVIDGAMAAKYLATVKDLLEKPATLLV